MADVKPRVVMTGAAGDVGTTLWRAWEEEDRYELTLVDLQPLSVSHTRSSSIPASAARRPSSPGSSLPLEGARLP